MSVIDTLVFAFRGDTRDAEMALDRTTKKANSAEGAISGLIKRGAGFLGGFLGVQAVAQNISMANDEMVRLVETSQRIGVSVGDLDAWSRAVADAGGNVESFQQSIKGLAVNIQMFKTKGTSRAHPFFQELGIDEGKVKDVMELLPQLAGRFSEMSEQEAIGYGTKLGIDEYTIGVLLKGRDAVEQMIAQQKALGVLTDEQAEKVEKYDETMDALGNTFKVFWRILAIQVMPIMQGFAKSIMGVFTFIKEHKYLIEGLGIAIAVFLGGFAVAAVYSFVTALTVWKVAALAAAAANALMAAPLYLMIALIAALAAAFVVLYEDFRVWQEGGESFLGDHLGKWEDFRDNVIGIIDAIKSAWMGMWETVSNTAKDIWENAKLISNPKELAKKSWEGAKSLGADIVSGAQNLEQARQQAAIANSNQFNAQMGTPPAQFAGKTQSTTVGIGDVTINTQATDGEEIAGSFSGWLEKQLKDATAGFDNGVEA